MMGGKLVVINLQRTPLEPLAHINIFGLIDDVFEKTMEKLKIPIPDWELKRNLKVRLATGSDGFEYIVAEGIDKDGTFYTHYETIEIQGEKYS